MTNVFMIVDRFFPIWGGAENQLLALAERLRTHGIGVTVVTRRWTEDLEKAETLRGITIRRMGVPGPPTLRTDLCYAVCVALHVFRCRHRVDVVHTHGAVFLGAVGRMASVLSGKPNVVKIATAGKVPPLRRKLLGRAILFLLRRSTKVVALSGEIESELIAAGVPDTRIARIPNGVDLERFAPVSRECRETIRTALGLGPNDVAVLFSGRLVPRKGLDLLLDSWGVVSADHPEAHLWILGSGEHQADSVEAELKERAGKEALERVHWLGQSTKPETYYAAADIFAFPSRREGLSNTLLEAMACGLSPVASRIGGNTDVIAHETNGLLFDVDDSDGLAANLNRLLDAPAERRILSAAAREEVRKRFGLEETACAYVGLYGELCAGGKSGGQKRVDCGHSWMNRIQVTCLILLLAAFALYLVREREQVLAAVAQMNVRFLPFIIGLMVVMNLYKAVTWSCFARSLQGVRVSRRVLTGAWMTSILGKYLPGSVWDMFSRLLIMRKHGISGGRAGFCIVMEQVYSILASVFMVLITPELREFVHPAWVLNLFAVGLASLAIFPVGLKLMFGGLRLLKPNAALVEIPPTMARARYFLESCMSRLLSGILLGAMLALFQVEVNLNDLLRLSAILSLSFVGGYLFILTPGGVGVREGILVFFLSEWMSVPLALTLAFSLRLWGFLADMITVMIGRQLKPNLTEED